MSEHEDLPLPPQSDAADPPGLHDARGERKAGGTYAQERYSSARRSLERTDQLEEDRSTPEPSDKEADEHDRGRRSVEDAQAEASSRPPGDAV